MFVPPLFAKREDNILPYGVTESFIKNGRGNPSPTDKEGCSPKYGTDIFITRRGDHILAKQVCHEAKRNIESPDITIQNKKTGDHWSPVRCYEIYSYVGLHARFVSLRGIAKGERSAIIKALFFASALRKMFFLTSALCKAHLPVSLYRETVFHTSPFRSTKEKVEFSYTIYPLGVFSLGIEGEPGLI